MLHHAISALFNHVIPSHLLLLLLHHVSSVDTKTEAEEERSKWIDIDPFDSSERKRRGGGGEEEVEDEDGGDSLTCAIPVTDMGTPCTELT